MSANSLQLVHSFTSRSKCISTVQARGIRWARACALIDCAFVVARCTFSIMVVTFCGRRTGNLVFWWSKFVAGAGAVTQLGEVSVCKLHGAHHRDRPCFFTHIFHQAVYCWGSLLFVLLFSSSCPSSGVQFGRGRQTLSCCCPLRGPSLWLRP